MSVKDKNEKLGKLYLSSTTRKEKNKVIEEIIKVNKGTIRVFAIKTGLGANIDDFTQNFALYMIKDMECFDEKKGKLYNFILGILWKTYTSTESQKGAIQSSAGKKLKYRSLNEKIKNGNGRELIDDVMASDQFNSDEYEKIIQKLITKSIINRVEANIIKYRIVNKMKFSEIGDLFETNREAIRQRYHYIIKKIKKHVNSNLGVYF